LASLFSRAGLVRNSPPELLSLRVEARYRRIGVWRIGVRCALLTARDANVAALRAANNSTKNATLTSVATVRDSLL
jgi:hypothetical protein